ncbi:MAG: response regulator [Sediminimonas sp.]|uniref:response regulator transcription factor n=1 Tax=Sediminimonas sp. TaxID=2823379 RepID=UPI0028702BEC|nr:response regulator [Sediminimonas sp.]MDR9483923.1 response regulator [Sediminimonas sp.]
MRILIVDDDPMFLDLLEGGLAACGFDDVARAETADHALELVDTRDIEFDCFILDILMPGTDGIELCASIRSKPNCRSAPIIMLTSSDARNTMQTAFEAGATDFLNKPLNMVELGARIRMAFLLVEAVNNENTNVPSLSALSKLSQSSEKFEPGTRITFSSIKSMRDYHELESKLTKLGRRRFSISLFSIKIADFEGISQASTRHEMMGLIHMSAGVISRVMPNQDCHFSYVGYGEFVCVAFIQTPLAAGLLQTRLRSELSMCVRNSDNPKICAAELDVSPLSERRDMTAEHALMVVRNYSKVVGSISEIMLPPVDDEADRLFDKIRSKE